MVVVWVVDFVVCFGGDVVDEGIRGFCVRSDMIEFVRKLRDRSVRNGEKVVVCVSDNRGNFKGLCFDNGGVNY